MLLQQASCTCSKIPLFRHYYHQWNRFEDFAVAYCNFWDICCFNLNLNSASFTLFPVTLENQAFSLSSSTAALMSLPPASFLCLWICLEFPVDRVSRVPSFSPSLACVATIFPERSCKECLSPEHSGMEALGGTRGSLLYLPWTLPPGHYHLLFSFFKVCNVIHSSQRSVDLKCSDTLLSWISYYWLIALFYNCVDTVLCMKWNGFTFDMKVSKIFLSAHYSLLWGILLFFPPFVISYPVPVGKLPTTVALHETKLLCMIHSS